MRSLCVVAVFLLFALQSSVDDVRTALVAASKDTPDRTDFAEGGRYRDLVAALLELKPVDIEALHPTALDTARALAEPDSQRGAWVTASGYVTLKHTVPLQSPIGTLKQVERVILKLDRETAIACDLIGDPLPYRSQADTVKVSGVFFRTVSYENVDGKQTTLPYMLARSMELVATPSSTLAKSLFNGGPQLYMGIFLGALGVIVFVLYLRRSARSET